MCLLPFRSLALDLPTSGTSEDGPITTRSISFVVSLVHLVYLVCFVDWVRETRQTKQTRAASRFSLVMIHAR
jgi:hypothetical protein